MNNNRLKKILNRLMSERQNKIEMHAKVMIILLFLKYGQTMSVHAIPPLNNQSQF